MLSHEIRRTFLEFFAARGHEVSPSAPLVSRNDPTLMFVNAGMVPFKDVFTGRETRASRRATSSQKCIRISGKHNDLENVGRTARHHTFFEMLGNFSFGDYFKEQAIVFAWDLLSKTFQLSKDRLMFSVFGGEGTLGPDEEARALWKKVAGVDDTRVVGLGMADNFWSMGDTGPCGPCTEIYYYLGDGEADVGAFGQEPDAQGRGWFEIWNLVFMQYARAVKDGELAPLPAPSVDTGMGLERLASILQGKTSNYDTDLLRALVDRASELAGKPYRGSQADDDVSMRVIADHARTTAFLIAEGVLPDRAGREYVLRRVMRRAVRHGHRLGIKQPFLHDVALRVAFAMGDAYPDLLARGELIASISEQEEVRFRETIDRGLRMLDEEIVSMGTKNRTVISGDVAFKLYDTFGFPLDLTEVIASERSLDVDVAGYEAALEAQKQKSAGSKVGEEVVTGVWRAAFDQSGPVQFLGYEREEATSEVVAIVNADALVMHASAGDTVGIVTTATPFYGEAGGQVGDRGVITNVAGKDARVQIDDTQKPVGGLIVHLGQVAVGSLSVGDEVRLTVDHERRSATRRNHSATHLLHYALRNVLGDKASQKGSLVGPDKLRFDFAFGRALTAPELSRIEDLVNEKVLGNAPVETEVMPIDVAKKKGAVAIFEEKYGDVVRVLTMTKDSVELCGGTHARALGEIGLFKILSEAGIAAGVRRIEAATGLNALAYVRQLKSTLDEAASGLGANLSTLPKAIERAREERKALEKEIADLKRLLATGGGGGPNAEIEKARPIAGGKALALKVAVADPAMMREVAEQLRDKLGDAVVLVGASSPEKAQLVLTVSKSLTDRYKAGEIIKSIAQIVGGSGGGRPDMAQAGGPLIDKLDAALEAFYARFE